MAELHLRGILLYKQNKVNTITNKLTNKCTLKAHTAHVGSAVAHVTFTDSLHSRSSNIHTSHETGLFLE